MPVEMVTVSSEESGDRLDRWLKRRYADVTQGQVEKLLRTGQVRLDGKRAKSSARVEAGQVVRVPPLAAGPGRSPEAGARAVRKTAASSKDIKALQDAVIFKDDWVLAINKPSGLAVQGGTGQSRHVDAMLDGLIFDRKDRPKLVHRLDRDTSGVLLLARTGAAARDLTAAFRGKDARKIYWAVVVGKPPKARGVIDMSLGKAASEGGMEKVAALGPAGKRALTLYQTIATGKGKSRGLTWLALMPLTGRTHQLRVHCAEMGMPIVGDGKYGGKQAFPAKPDFPKRLMLHAQEIALPHPDDGTTLRIAAPLPADMQAAWKAFHFDIRHGENVANDLATYADALDLEKRKPDSMAR
ncbi:RluA family pseudouridine synthase [Denitrobaculum tricleocarpae]|uniref:Pseudouridine synthase n=1 Tax=Denitrobaculum tricleocarpae TaxID=2591009 RepID=A0A545U2N4_9PROT|nr:RluA family pseudouridine synthase [Denitrobaculum tricleocarpae]TQV83745.1 RluA family pseudouridine synthase [Denitrobaculum tricleocarpae]